MTRSEVDCGRKSSLKCTMDIIDNDCVGRDTVTIGLTKKGIDCPALVCERQQRTSTEGMFDGRAMANGKTCSCDPDRKTNHLRSLTADALLARCQSPNSQINSYRALHSQPLQTSVPHSSPFLIPPFTALLHPPPPPASPHLRYLPSSVFHHRPSPSAVPVRLCRYSRSPTQCCR